MNQLYPDAMCDVNLNRANESGGLVSPPEEDFATDSMRGSMQQMLSDNLGLYVMCEFLVGTQAMTQKEGILYNVGRSFLTLYDEVSQDFIVCDIFSLKFVTFSICPASGRGRSGAPRYPRSTCRGWAMSHRGRLVWAREGPRPR